MNDLCGWIIPDPQAPQARGRLCKNRAVYFVKVGCEHEHIYTAAVCEEHKHPSPLYCWECHKIDGHTCRTVYADHTLIKETRGAGSGLGDDYSRYHRVGVPGGDPADGDRRRGLRPDEEAAQDPAHEASADRSDRVG